MGSTIASGQFEGKYLDYLEKFNSFSFIIHMCQLIVSCYFVTVSKSNSKCNY